MPPDLPSLSLDELETRIRLLLDEGRARGLELADEIATPQRLEEKIDQATRMGQVLSFLFIGPVVIVSLQLIVVLNQLMTDLLGVTPLGTQQDPIFAWLVTALTGGAYLLAAWTWFQFVRTAGFGLFAWSDLE